MARTGARRRPVRPTSRSRRSPRPPARRPPARTTSADARRAPRRLGRPAMGRSPRRRRLVWVGIDVAPARLLDIVQAAALQGHGLRRPLAVFVEEKLGFAHPSMMPPRAALGQSHSCKSSRAPSRRGPIGRLSPRWRALVRGMARCCVLWALRLPHLQRRPPHLSYETPLSHYCGRDCRKPCSARHGRLRRHATSTLGRAGAPEPGATGQPRRGDAGYALWYQQLRQQAGQAF